MRDQCGCCGAVVEDIDNHHETDESCHEILIEQERQVYDFYSEEDHNKDVHKSFLDYLRFRVNANIKFPGWTRAVLMKEIERLEA